MRNNLLNQITIGKPCQANWNEMTGTERRRFCERCQLHVHNLSAMSEGEINELLSKSQGRLCGRIEYTFPEYFSNCLRLCMRHFANVLKIGLAALAGFVGLSSSANAQAVKVSLQKAPKPSVTQPAKRAHPQRKKSARRIYIATTGVITPQIVQYQPPKPELVMQQIPLPKFIVQNIVQNEEEEPPPPPKKPDGSQNL